MYAWTERPGERIALACGGAWLQAHAATGRRYCCAHCQVRSDRFWAYRNTGTRGQQPDCQATHRFTCGKPAATLSTSELPAGASSPALSYLSGHSYPASRRAIRSQLRCDPDSRSDVHTLLFHRISYSVRPMDTPPCRMLFLFLHMLWVMPIAKQLYIQNEGLSDIFCRHAEFLIAQVLVGLSTAYRANRFRRRASSVLPGWTGTSSTTAKWLDCRALACFTRCSIAGMTCCMYCTSCS